MKILPKPAYLAGLPGLKVLILVTALGLAMCTWYVLFHRLHDGITWFPAAPQCNLNIQACSANLGDEGRLTLRIDVRGPIRALAPLPLVVDIEGVASSQVSVDFVSRNENSEVGVYRFVLDAILPGHFRGRGQLGNEPSVAPGVAPWRARVILDTPKGKMGSWFDFNALSS